VVLLVEHRVILKSRKVSGKYFFGSFDDHGFNNISDCIDVERSLQGQIEPHILGFLLDVFGNKAGKCDYHRLEVLLRQLSL